MILLLYPILCAKSCPLHLSYSYYFSNQIKTLILSQWGGNMDKSTKWTTFVWHTFPFLYQFLGPHPSFSCKILGTNMGQDTWTVTFLLMWAPLNKMIWYSFQEINSTPYIRFLPSHDMSMFSYVYMILLLTITCHKGYFEIHH